MDVNEAYELYCADPTEFNLWVLLSSLNGYALRMGRKMMRAYHVSIYRHACHNAAVNVLVQFKEKYDPTKSSFSTWAYRSIRGDLVDWWRKRQRRREVSLDEPGVLERSYRGIYITDLSQSNTELDEIFATFTDEERRLCEMRNDGASLQEMADALGVSLATIKRRWKAIVEKGRGLLVS